MSVQEDLKVAAGLKASLGFRDSTPLLEPDPTQAVMDRHIGRRLGWGHRDFVFQGPGPIPNFRVTDEDQSVDAQNCARHELYLRRLSEVGVDQQEMSRRQQRGFRVKARVRAMKGSVLKLLGTPSIEAHDRSGVQRQFKVVK